ncbi:MAG: hypothetical protein V1726_02620 [Methanobacteriota archaeon]
MRVITWILFLNLLFSTFTVGVATTPLIPHSKNPTHMDCSKDPYRFPYLLTRFFPQISRNINIKVNQNTRDSQLDTTTFTPVEVTLNDDAFHGAGTLHFTEWWYFDALLDHGYSIQMIIQIINLMNQQVALVKTNLYNQGNLILSKEKIYGAHEFSVSTEKPFILLNGKPAMTAYNQNGNIVYDVSLEIEEFSIQLHFLANAQGWKGSIAGGQWIVPVPNAEVQGILQLNNTKIPVQGRGYHDHNAGLTLQTSMQYRGWYWGKLDTNTTTIVWSSLITKKMDQQPLLVITQGKQHYQSIPPENIHFQAINWYLEDGVRIPHAFILQAEATNLSLNLTMTAFTTHHVKVGFLSYWRYHVQCLGTITSNSITEKINQTQISEYIRFT